MSHAEIARHVERIQSIVAGPESSVNAESSYISQSWRRCLIGHKLDPSRPCRPVIMDRAELKPRQERLERLLSIATSEMTNLYQQLAGSGYAILLTDADGVVLNYVGDPSFNDEATHAGLTNGALWDESVQGTNGMGTCLVERKPLVVHHNEHFLAKNTSLTCSAAPIRDPGGNLVAVLDASSRSAMAQQHTMVLVNMSAQLIENRLFLCTYRNQYIARFHSRAEFVSTLGEGILAFDGAGRILGATRSALFQLDLRSQNEIIGKPITDIFTIPLDSLLGYATHQPFQGVLYCARDGRRFFALLQRTDWEHWRPTRRDQSTTRHERPGSPAIAGFEGLEFGDPRVAGNISRAKQLIHSNIPLLLYGETGSGKGVFAKALHAYSERAEKPFVAVSCASIPETLIESELFGYKAGAFTGANRRGSRGKIVHADGGTLFLDEIGDMPLTLQARLLRVLEEKEVVPLGDAASIKVDIAIISATHRDLKQLIQQGRFREDLYYRLCGMVLTLPPFRERTDKQRLIEHLLRLEQGCEPTIKMDYDAMQLLMQYNWPGNVRELCNTLRTMIALCHNHHITAADVCEVLHPDNVEAATAGEQVDAVKGQFSNPLAAAEYAALLRELESARWNISKLARKCNVSRNTLYRKMKRFGITPPR